jgi:hypothetical protein
MSEETKDTCTGKETTEACCKPGDMQKFFQKMAACCSGQGDMPDCKAMMEGMKAKFCGQKTEKTKTGCGD